MKLKHTRFSLILILGLFITGCVESPKEEFLLLEAFREIVTINETKGYFNLHGLNYSADSIGISANPIGPLYATYSKELYRRNQFVKSLESNMKLMISDESNLDSLLQHLTGEYTETKDAYYFTPSVEIIDEENKPMLISFSKPFKGIICAELYYVKNKYKKEFTIVEYLLAYNPKGEIEDVFAKTTEIIDL